MKLKSLKILLASFAILTVFTSCTTTKTESEPDPYFLADMNAFEIGEVVGLTKQNLLKPKPANILVDFYPRTSSVAYSFRDGANKVYLIFSPEEFKNLSDSVNKYTELKEAEAFDKSYKPTRKNHFHRGKISILWGTIGYGREVTAPFDTNYEWVTVNNETNPFFRIEVKATSVPDEEHVNSPTVTVYFTPSQAKALISVVNMDEIMEEVNKFNSAAYDFKFE